MLRFSCSTHADHCYCQHAILFSYVPSHNSVVQYLVEEAKAELNKTNNMGDTALSVACFWGRVSLIFSMNYNTFQAFQYQLHSHILAIPEVDAGVRY
jgi:ankyrin repeat protein